jgi:hypothetical protein
MIPAARREDALQKYYRIEGARLGMTEVEIEDRWLVHAETLKVIESIQKERG